MSHNWLKPDWEPGLTIQLLPLQHFLENNIQALIIDVDGTLLPGREQLLSNTVRSWVNDAKGKLVIYLLSNNPSQKRIEAVAKQLGVSFTCAAAKPRRGALRKVISHLEISPENIAIIGDRIFTDIIVGNRLGLYTVLVRPLNSKRGLSKKQLVQKIELKLANLLSGFQA